jgi:hypothetical protein
MKTRIETRIREPEGYPIYEIIPEELVS